MSRWEKRTRSKSKVTDRSRPETLQLSKAPRQPMKGLLAENRACSDSAQLAPADLWYPRGEKLVSLTFTASGSLRTRRSGVFRFDESDSFYYRRKQRAAKQESSTPHRHIQEKREYSLGSGWWQIHNAFFIRTWYLFLIWTTSASPVCSSRCGNTNRRPTVRRGQILAPIRLILS